jgi:hypothetical protein
MWIDALFSLSMLAGAAAPAEAPPTPDESAAGTVRSIQSAQAFYKKANPAVGYACDIETLVKADALVPALAGGKVYGGYVFKVSCSKTSKPQLGFRASGVPAKAGIGRTYCADESNVLRATTGDATACFAKGTPVK